MKICQGFVSNSSSSSFAIIIPKERHDKIMESLHPYIQACVNCYSPGISTMDGQLFVTLGGLSVMDSSIWDYVTVVCDEEKPKDFSKYETIGAYEAKAKELFGNACYIAWSADA